MNAVRFPRSRGRSLLTILLAVSCLISMTAACEPAASPAEYGAELAACTATAKARQAQGATTKAEACQESIACENRVRASHKREPRDASKGCD